MTKVQALRKVVTAYQRRAEVRRRSHLQLVEAINEAVDAGASLREIGRALGMSHVAVTKIIRTGATPLDE